MLPADAVGRHRIAGWRRQLAAVRRQRLLDRVGIGRLGEIVDGAFLHGGDGGCNVAVTGQHHNADVRPCLAQRSHQFEAIAVPQSQVEHGECGWTRGLRQRLGDRADGGDDESALLERARDAIAECRIIVRDQQSTVLVGRRTGDQR